MTQRLGDDERGAAPEQRGRGRQTSDDERSDAERAHHDVREIAQVRGPAGVGAAQALVQRLDAGGGRGGGEDEGECRDLTGKRDGTQRSKHERKIGTRRSARPAAWYGAAMRLVPVVLACAGLLACIERPETPRSRAASVDRSKLGDVLSTTAPVPQVPVGAVFDGALELVGYDVSPREPKGGDTVEVTFWFRAKSDLTDDWQVFVHLDDEGKQAARVHGDHWPAKDRFRTSAWRAGDVVRDTWSFTAPGNVERLQIWTGLYSGETRMPLTQVGRGVSDGQNRVRAGTIVLR